MADSTQELADAIRNAKARDSAPQIMWQHGVSQTGVPYTVYPVEPNELDKMMTGQSLNYWPQAVTVPGLNAVYVNKNLDPSKIPWGHEEMHLDGFTHDANQNWFPKK